MPHDMALVMLLASLILLVSQISARPQLVSIGPDSYRLKFQTLDGTSREESGVLKNPGTADEEWSVVGEFSWVDPDGKEHHVSFTADKNGYRATDIPVRKLPIELLSGPGLSIRGALAG